MQKILLSLAVGLQVIAPVSALAATATLSDIFVDDPKPEFSERHTRTEPWDGHRVYHLRIVENMKGWEAEWIKQQVTPPYTLVKRAALRRLQMEHRKAHRDAKAPVNVSPATTQPSSPAKVRASKVPRIEPLPKRSHRLLEKEVLKQIRK